MAGGTVLGWLVEEMVLERLVEGTVLGWLAGELASMWLLVEGLPSVSG
jgi:hypothetical protein